MIRHRWVALLIACAVVVSVACADNAVQFADEAPVISDRTTAEFSIDPIEDAVDAAIEAADEAGDAQTPQLSPTDVDEHEVSSPSAPTRLGGTLSCRDATQLRLSWSRISIEVAEVANQFPSGVWLCENNQAANNATTCFPELFSDLLEVLAAEMDPDDIATIRQSNTVLCRAADPSLLAPADS